jgi:DNA-binding NarL/FixJ family response regulator
MRTILEEADDFEIVGEAENGKEAVRLALSTVPDLILMDIHMPVMDGLDAIEHILSWKMMRIVVLSADKTCETEYAAMQAGALRVLPKPCMDWTSQGVESFHKVLRLLGQESAC